MRHILHLRMDAFPVAVERLRDASLVHKPVVVCSRHSPRSLVFSASPEARKEGVFSGQPLTKALQRCKSLVILPPDEKLYQRATDAVIKILDRYSPLVEPGGLGRFYMDMTGTRRLLGLTQDAASGIRKNVLSDLRLASTLGIGSNKLVSGVAARVVCRFGDLYEVPSGSESSFLAPLRVRMLPAVRSRVERELLAEFNIRHIAQLANISIVQLASVFGKTGKLLHRQALGIDERPVLKPGTKPFVLEEITLAEDSNDDAVLLGTLYAMTERACRRMRIQNVTPQTVWLHLRYSDGMDITRRMKLVHSILIDPLLFEKVEPFFLKTNFRRQRVRYMGITFTDLRNFTDQMGLFDAFQEPQREENLVSALDVIRKKYGDTAVAWGKTLCADEKIMLSQTNERRLLCQAKM